MRYLMRSLYVGAILFVAACSATTPFAVPNTHPSPTAVPANGNTFTPSPTPVPTATPVATATASPGPSASATGTAAATATPSAMPTATPSVMPTASPTFIPTASPTAPASSVPTAGATTTPAATSTPLATPTPAATNIVVDGGFEAEGSANMTLTSWTPCSFPHATAKTPTPQISSALITADVVSANNPSFTVGSTASPIATVTDSPNSGTYAALAYTGTGANLVTNPPATSPMVSKPGVNGICQTFVLPANPTLQMYVNEGGDESGLAYGDQEADIFPGPISGIGTATAVPLFAELNVQSSSPSTATNGYVLRGPFTLTAAPYSLTPGQTYTLFVGAYDSSPSTRFGTYIFVDDVTLIGNPIFGMDRTRRFSNR